MKKLTFNFLLLMQLAILPALSASDDTDSSDHGKKQNESSSSEHDRLLATSNSVTVEEIRFLFEQIFAIYATDGFLDLRFLGNLGQEAQPTLTFNLRDVPPQTPSLGERLASHLCPRVPELTYRLLGCCCIDLPYFFMSIQRGPVHFICETDLDTYAQQLLQNANEQTDWVRARQDLGISLAALRQRLTGVFVRITHDRHLRTLLPTTLWLLIGSYAFGTRYESGK